MIESKKAKRFAVLLTSLCISVVAMVACSQTPSSNDAESFLRQKIDSESGGKIKLVSFKKTDGQKGEIGGIQFYHLTYDADVEFEGDGTWLVGAPIITFRFSDVQPKQGSWANVGNMMEGGRIVHRGDHAKISGDMGAQKNESGWKFEVGESHIASATTTAASVAPPQDSTKCKGYLQLLTLFVRLYLNDNNRYPPATKWCDALRSKGYASDTNAFHCPSRPELACAYSMNAHLEGANFLNLSPSTVLLFESKGGWNSAGGPEIAGANIHGSAVLVSFVDGSIREVPADQIASLRWNP